MGPNLSKPLWIFTLFLMKAIARKHFAAISFAKKPLWANTLSCDWGLPHL